MAFHTAGGQHRESGGSEMLFLAFRATCSGGVAVFWEVDAFDEENAAPFTSWRFFRRSGKWLRARGGCEIVKRNNR